MLFSLFFSNKIKVQTCFWNSENGKLFVKTFLIFENVKYFLKYLTKICEKEQGRMQVENNLNFIPLRVVCCKPFKTVILQCTRAGWWHWQICFALEVVVFYNIFFLPSNKCTHRYLLLISIGFSQLTFWFSVRPLLLLCNHVAKSGSYNRILFKEPNLWLEWKQIKRCRTRMVKEFEATWE